MSRSPVLGVVDSSGMVWVGKDAFDSDSRSATPIYTARELEIALANQDRLMAAARGAATATVLDYADSAEDAETQEIDEFAFKATAEMLGLAK